MYSQSFDASGAVVYWSAGPTQRDLLAARLATVGLAEHLPAVRTDAAALKSALLEFCRPMKTAAVDYTVHPHARQADNGFDVVRAERDAHANDYCRVFGARVEPIWQRLDVDGELATFEQGALAELYRRHKSQLTGAAIGNMLVDILAALGGTALRPSGGVYWIPGHAVAMFEQIIALVEETAEPGHGNKVYLLQTPMNAQTVRAVRDAITAEIMSATAEIERDVTENLTTESAINRRIDAARGLRNRVAEYESILGELLPALHTACNSAEQAAASAVAVKDSNNVFAGLFSE